MEEMIDKLKATAQPLLIPMSPRPSQHSIYS